MVNYCVLTAYDARAREYGDLGRQSKESYCQQHQIPFHCETTWLPPDQDGRWIKLIVIPRYLARYEWLFWMDADTMIVNQEKGLQPPQTSKDLVLSWDKNAINNGVMWVRNCPWAFDFLLRCYCDRDIQEPRLATIADNGAMIHQLEENPDDFDHVEIVHQRHWNSYLHNGSYQEGDLVLHFPGEDKGPMFKCYENLSKPPS